jgi:hypothetical protein
MDELQSTFGRLSTQAAEWKPKIPTAPEQQQHPGFKLKNAVVKDYSPDQGWSVTDATGEGIE